MPDTQGAVQRQRSLFAMSSDVAWACIWAEGWPLSNSELYVGRLISSLLPEESGSIYYWMSREQRRSLLSGEADGREALSAVIVRMDKWGRTICAERAQWHPKVCDMTWMPRRVRGGSWQGTQPVLVSTDKRQMVSRSTNLPRRVGGSGCFNPMFTGTWVTLENPIIQ